MNQSVSTIGQTLMFAVTPTKQVTINPRVMEVPPGTEMKILKCLVWVYESITGQEATSTQVWLSCRSTIDPQGRDTNCECSTQANSTISAERLICLSAIDNSDFNEDTPDGRRILHATATAVFPQQHQPQLQQCSHSNISHSYSSVPTATSATATAVFPQQHQPRLQQCSHSNISHGYSSVPTATSATATAVFPQQHQPRLQQCSHSNISHGYSSVPTATSGQMGGALSMPLLQLCFHSNIRMFNLQSTSI